MTTEVTPKQFRVAAQHLAQAQESLRLARHFLGGIQEEMSPSHATTVFRIDEALARIEPAEHVYRVCGVE